MKIHLLTRYFLLFGVLSLLPVKAQEANVTILYSFNNAAGNAGYEPRAGLVEGTNGNFYGVTYQGGTNGFGTIFEMTPSGAVTEVYDFDRTTGADPQAPLIVGNDGNFYGIALGGEYSLGTAFQFTSGGAISNFCSFLPPAGDSPAGPLIQGQDGNFYGVTEDSATFGYYGTAYQLQLNGTITTLCSFNATDGSEPEGGLVQGPDGTLYGTTSTGGTTNDNGANGYGTIFKVTTNGTFQSMWSFNETNGSNPHSRLVFGPDGNLYGTTYGGGTNSYEGSGPGTIFRISPAGNFTSLVSLNDAQGGNIIAGLLLANDGNFYGVTSSGGPDYDGTIFRVTTNGTFTTLYAFTNASTAWGTLIQGTDGNIYGTTEFGGTYGYGTVFVMKLAAPVPAPVILSTVETNETFALTWSAVSNDTYQVQYSTNLLSTNWTNLNAPVTATNATASGADNVTGAAQRFYRVLLLQ